MININEYEIVVAKVTRDYLTWDNNSQKKYKVRISKLSYLRDATSSPHSLQPTLLALFVYP